MAPPQTPSVTQLLFRIEGKLDRLTEAFNAHLLLHAGEAGERRGVAKIARFSKAGIALVVSVLSGTVAVVSLIR